MGRLISSNLRCSFNAGTSSSLSHSVVSAATVGTVEHPIHKVTERGARIQGSGVYGYLTTKNARSNRL